MAGSARQKIDPQTRDMFDLEVDKPDHDRILTTLFADDVTLLRLLEELHSVRPWAAFNASSQFKVRSTYGNFERWVDYAEAVKLTGVPPTWSTTSPVRMVSKQMEVPLLWWSNNERSSRIMGFCDIGIAYEIVEWPIINSSNEGKHRWERVAPMRHALIEVKGTWPTVGNLMRQLNLYRACSPQGFTGRCQMLLVGPDASMNEIACQHHYRLATFDASGKAFTLQAEENAPVRRLTTEGVF